MKAEIAMADLFKRNTISEKPLFGKFNLLYGDALVAICPLLNKFKIGVYTVAEYLNLPPEIPPIDDIQNQPFAFFLCKDGDNASATDVGIIYNVAAIHRIELTEGEEYASIAHEIGHILFFFNDSNQIERGGQGEEIYADSIATRIGLARYMLSAIKKLDNSGLFPGGKSRFGMRELKLRIDSSSSFQEL